MLFDLNTFSTDYLAPAIIILGLFGNLFGLIVISKKKLKKIGPQTVYIALFIFDYINFLLIFQSYIQQKFNIDITLFSSLACKLYWYLNFAFGPISPMLNVYISIERYFSIAHQTMKHFFIKKKIQFAFIIAVTLYNLLLYIPMGLYTELIVIESNQTNLTIFYMDSYINYICNVIDLVNRVIIPFLFMITFSILIIYSIFSSRRRISPNVRTNKANRVFRKDVRLSFIIILLNISFIVLSLPVTAIYFLSEYWFSYLMNFFNYLYFFSFCTNFYLMFSVNSLFRGGFYSIFIFSNKTKTTKQVIKNINVNSRRNGTKVNTGSKENKIY